MTEVAGEARHGEQRPDVSARDQATKIRICEGSEGGRSGKQEAAVAPVSALRGAGGGGSIRKKP
jgi:hypothetical protein